MHNIHEVVAVVDLLNAVVRFALFFVDRSPLSHQRGEGLLPPELKGLVVDDSRLDDLLVAEHAPSDRVDIVGLNVFHLFLRHVDSLVTNHVILLKEFD